MAAKECADSLSRPGSDASDASEAKQHKTQHRIGSWCYDVFVAEALCPNELVARIMGKGGTRKDPCQSPPHVDLTFLAMAAMKQAVLLSRVPCTVSRHNGHRRVGH